MDTASSGPVISPTGGDAISSTAFLVLTWILFSLCNIAFAARASIRFMCFGRLLLEDYLMLVALSLHIAEAVLIQLYVPAAYTLEAVQKGDYSRIGPDFFSVLKTAFVAVGASVNMTMVGVLIVKLNFLLFFRRLSTNIPKFAIMWWAVLLFTVAGTMAQIGMQQFGCFFGSTDYIFSQNCAGEKALRRIFFNAIFSAATDALSDIFSRRAKMAYWLTTIMAEVVGFPVAILWKSRIDMRKKIILTFTFGLVFVTIAITIVRGSVFHRVYSANGTGEAKEQSLTFTWFWFYCEFSVAIIIACIVSFRTLFVQRKSNPSVRLREQQQRREASYQSAIRRGWRNRVRQFHGSMVDTCKTLEGWPDHDSETLAMRGLPSVVSGSMTVDFNDDTNWGRSVGTNCLPTTKSWVNQQGSAQSLLVSSEATSVHVMER